MVLALGAILAMVALIIDGGNAFAQQRQTQNGTDAAAESGAVMLAQNIGQTTPIKTDQQVVSAVNAAATANGLSTPTAYYTDISGRMLTWLGTTTTSTTSAAQVGQSPTGLPAPCLTNCVETSASGIRAMTAQVFGTFVARAIGISQLTAYGDATAVSGYLPGGPAGAVLPVTFPTTTVSCSGNGNPSPGPNLWPIVTPPATPAAANEQTVPLCKNGPGSVGWLAIQPEDNACGGGVNDLACDIQNPDNPPLVIPNWFQTQTGNTNSSQVQNAMNTWNGKVIALPVFDCTATTATQVLLANPQPTAAPCPTPPAPGNGNNTWYHVPHFLGFLLDQAYIQGNNSAVCGGNGATGCLKGWFVQFIGPPGPVTTTSSGPGTPISVQLIK